MTPGGRMIDRRGIVARGVFRHHTPSSIREHVRSAPTKESFFHFWAFIFLLLGLVSSVGNQTHFDWTDYVTSHTNLTHSKNVQHYIFGTWGDWVTTSMIDQVYFQ